MEEDAQNPNILRNFSLYKVGLKKGSLKGSESTGEGGGGVKVV